MSRLDVYAIYTDSEALACRISGNARVGDNQAFPCLAFAGLSIAKE